MRHRLEMQKSGFSRKEWKSTAHLIERRYREHRRELRNKASRAHRPDPWNHIESSASGGK